MWQWWFFACGVVLATWAYLTRKEWAVLGSPQPGPRLRATVRALVRLLIPVSVLTAGFVLEPILGSPFLEGSLRTPEPGEIWIAFFSALVPAGIVAVASGIGRSRTERVKNAVAAAVLSLLLLDNIWNILARRPIEQFLFSLFSDVIGGTVAGVVVGLASELTRGSQPGESAAGRPQSLRG